MIRRHESEVLTLTEQESTAITELKRQLVTTFRVDSIILFGSKARGDHRKDSDVDVLVIVEEEETFENRMKLYDHVFDINYQYGTEISCKLRNREKWIRGEGDYPLFIRDVIEEGIEFEL